MRRLPLERLGVERRVDPLDRETLPRLAVLRDGLAAGRLRELEDRLTLGLLELDGRLTLGRLLELVDGRALRDDDRGAERVVRTLDRWTVARLGVLGFTVRVCGVARRRVGVRCGTARRDDVLLGFTVRVGVLESEGRALFVGVRRRPVVVAGGERRSLCVGVPAAGVLLRSVALPTARFPACSVTLRRFVTTGALRRDVPDCVAVGATRRLLDNSF